VNFRAPFISPSAVILNLSSLLVIKTKSVASVVPNLSFPDLIWNSRIKTNFGKEHHSVFVNPSLFLLPDKAFAVPA
jgi:hypothetical protein